MKTAHFREVAIETCLTEAVARHLDVTQKRDNQVGVAVIFVRVLGSSNRQAPGLVNFVPALAYHYCLNLPAAFTLPGAHLLVEPCTLLTAQSVNVARWR